MKKVIYIAKNMKIIMKHGMIGKHGVVVVLLVEEVKG